MKKIEFTSSWDDLIPACQAFRRKSESVQHKRNCELFQYPLFHMDIEGCYNGLLMAIQNDKQFNN